MEPAPFTISEPVLALRCAIFGSYKETFLEQMFLFPSSQKAAFSSAAGEPRVFRRLPKLALGQSVCGTTQALVACVVQGARERPSDGEAHALGASWSRSRPRLLT